MRFSNIFDWHRLIPKRITLRIKLTFYICTAVLLCMGIMAAICITMSLNVTQKLMSQRLAYFSSIKAEQTERELHNEAIVLATVLQGDRITNTLRSVYFGNITSLKWATDMNSIVSDMYTTNLRPVQLITFYDVRGNILFSSRNPHFNNESVSKIRDGLTTLFPLGHIINVTADTGFAGMGSSNHSTNENGTMSFYLNQTFEAANSSQLEAFAAQAAIDASESQNSSTAISKIQDSYKPPINFVKLENGLSGWMAPPVPIFNSSGGIGSYSYSLTTQLTHLQVMDSVQSSTLIGYCTAVIDASRFMNGSYTLETTADSPTTNEFSLTVIGTSNEFWKFIFPTDVSQLNKLHPLYTFPAVRACRDMWKRHTVSNRTSKPGGAMMNTQAPNITRASVGYSFVSAFGSEWMIMVSVPRAQVEHSYWVQIHKLIGVAFAVLAFCALTALLSTNFIVKPLLYINRGMELQPREFHNKQKLTKVKTNEKQHELHQSITLWHNIDSASEHSSSEFSTDSNQRSHTGSSLTAIDERESKAKKDNDFEKNSEELNDGESGVHPYMGSELSVNSGSAGSATLRTVTTTQNGDFEEEDELEVFRIPAKIVPLNRWFVDEVDELIEVYNCLVDRLVRQHTKVEDEVRLRTQEARESQRLAETANTAKSRFMMNISHELLTPMNGIMGITAVSLEETRLPQVYAGLRTILKSGNVLQELLNELLTYAAHLAGIEQSFQQFTLQRLATSIEETFSNRATAKGINFKVTISPPALGDCQVESDYERLMHICTSLVSNAMKFSDPDKQRDLQLHKPHSSTKWSNNKSMVSSTDSDRKGSSRVWINILLRKPDKYVELPAGKQAAIDKYTMLEIVVSDNGVGISKDKLAHIFEVFEQGEDALSKHFTGTGLGLAMSKLLCEALGGSISVSSCKYVGTIVELRVPVYNMSDYKVENRPSFPLAFNNLGPHQVVWRTNTRNTQLVQLNTGVGHLRRSSRSRLTISHHAHHSRGSSGGSSSRSAPPSPTGCSSSAAPGTITEEKQQQQQQKQEEQQNETYTIPNLTDLSVLVVDDNAMLRSLYTKMFERIGVGKIDVAFNGEDAIRLVEKAIVKGTRYRIIFMDLEMPNKNGVETTEFIWRQLGYNSPVVALTGHSDEQTLKRCREMGLSRVLVKPVNQKELYETILALTAQT